VEARETRITGQRVHLFLHVKVNPRWKEDRDVYRNIGLDWVD
jgi:GTP-binding protein Era